MNQREPSKVEGVVHAAPKMHFVSSSNKPVKIILWSIMTTEKHKLAEKHNDDKLAIPFLIVMDGLITWLVFGRN